MDPATIRVVIYPAALTQFIQYNAPVLRIPHLVSLYQNTYTQYSSGDATSNQNWAIAALTTRRSVYQLCCRHRLDELHRDRSCVHRRMKLSTLRRSFQHILIPAISMPWALTSHLTTIALLSPQKLDSSHSYQT